MLEIETDNKSILMTGDFDTRDHPLTKGAEPRNVDTVFVEGTYGGRNHPNLDEEVKRFTERIVEVVDRGGTALVSCFRKWKNTRYCNEITQISSRNGCTCQRHG